MSVVDPMANLKVAIQRAARDRSMREGLGSGAFLPATRLIVSVLDATRDLEVATGLLEEASLLDSGVSEALIALHLHAARFVELCHHSQARLPALGLLDRSTFNRLSESVLTGRLVAARPASEPIQATIVQPLAITAASQFQGLAAPQFQGFAAPSAITPAAWPAPIPDHGFQLVSV